MKAVVIICLLVVCVTVLEACSPKPSTKKSTKKKGEKKSTKKGSKKTTKSAKTTTTEASRKRREASPIVVTLFSTVSIHEVNDLIEDLDNLIDGYDINKELILNPKPDIRIDDKDQVVLEYKVDPQVDCGDIQMAIERVKEELEDVSEIHVKCKDLELSL